MAHAPGPAAVAAALAARCRDAWCVPAAGSKGVDATSTSHEQHGWDIHALLPGTGGAGVTGDRSGARATPHRDNKRSGTGSVTVLEPTLVRDALQPGTLTEDISGL